MKVSRPRNNRMRRTCLLLRVFKMQTGRFAKNMCGLINAATCVTWEERCDAGMSVWECTCGQAEEYCLVPDQSVEVITCS